MNRNHLSYLTLFLILILLSLSSIGSAKWQIFASPSNNGFDNAKDRVLIFVLFVLTLVIILLAYSIFKTTKKDISKEETSATAYSNLATNQVPVQNSNFQYCTICGTLFMPNYAYCTNCGKSRYPTLPGTENEKSSL